MREGNSFRKRDIDAFVADSRFRRIAMHLPGWWQSLLHGISLKDLQRIYGCDDLRWEFVSSSVAFVGDRVRLIDEETVEQRVSVGLDTGSIEWAHLSIDGDDGEVIIVGLNGPGTEEEILLYATDSFAPQRFHAMALAARLPWRKEMRRRPLTPPHLGRIPMPPRLDIHSPMHFGARYGDAGGIA